MKKHKYLPTEEYAEEYNKNLFKDKIYPWCLICKEHSPCKYNLELEKNERDFREG